MYAKLFAQVVSSSLTHNETIEVRGVFFMMLAAADKSGNVPGPDAAIARLNNVPVDLFKASVDRLMAPDPESQSQEEDGRRLMRLEVGKGYRIVNYLKYASIATDQQRREYLRVKKQESRERLKAQQGPQQPSGRIQGSPTPPRPPKSLPGPIPAQGGPSQGGVEPSKNGIPPVTPEKPGEPALGHGNKPASVAEVVAFAREHGYPEVEAPKFWNHHESTSVEGVWTMGENQIPIGKWGIAFFSWLAKGSEYKRRKQGHRGQEEPTTISMLTTTTND